MKNYLVKVYNKADNSYRVAMETKDLDKAEDKMTRLSKQGHLVKIDLKPNETPDHLKDVPKDKLDTLVEIFKPRLQEVKNEYRAICKCTRYKILCI